MKRQVADRLFMSAISVVVVAVSQLEPASLSFVLVKSGGIWAQACMLFLFITSLVAAADTVVNDMLPPKYTLQTALGKRRGLWMCIAVTYAGIAFVVVKADISWSVSIFYLLFAARCAGVSFLDLYYEYADVVKDPATPLNPSIAGALGDE